jgi:regulation of enolase protein 1 (concanavalin A-like superfamily)
MFRFAAVLLCCIPLLVVTAAPVPPVRPSKVWVTGWDRPVFSNGDCRFERDGGRLTITATGGGQVKLLRDAEGDFVVQAKVGGTSSGIVIDDPKGGWVVTVLRDATSGHVTAGTLREGKELHIHILTGSSHLLLEREGGRLRMGHSTDGKKWDKLNLSQVVELSRKVKVGVTAASTPLKAEFDDFKLTPIGRRP